jgi:hypothetical protein
MYEMKRGRRHIVNVLAATCILVCGFTDIVEEIDIQEIIASML